MTMSDPIPGRGYHLSDHDGVEATLEVCRQENVAPFPRGRVIDGKSSVALVKHFYIVLRKFGTCVTKINIEHPPPPAPLKALQGFA